MTALDASALARDLGARVRGDVRFDEGSRALLATGGSNYRQVPLGVVIPVDVDDVVTAVGICSEHDAPVLPLGADTSLAGQSTNVAVVIDFSKYLNRIVHLDPDGGIARVQPGIILDHLRNAAERHRRTFGPDPSTHAYCTLGGMIGNNSCGVHSVMAGNTVDNVEELDVLTYDGRRLTVGATDEKELEEIIAAGGWRGQLYASLRDLRDRYEDLIRARYPHIPRRVSGYNLDQLLPENGFNLARALVGTEGTCVTVLEATVRLVPSPRARTVLVLGYPDVYAAADGVPEVMSYGPIGLEGIDDVLVKEMKITGIHREELVLLPPGRGWLLAEFGGETKEDADDQAHALMAHLERRPNAPSMRLYDDPRIERRIREVREAGLGATALVPGQRPAYEGWEDAAVPPERLGDYLRDFRALLDRFDNHGSLYGHFGQGCIHTRIDFQLSTAEGIGKFRSFIQEAADLVVAYGGSLSGEHGDGQSRAELLPKMFGEELVHAFGEFKSLWDPRGRMNPHKVVDPYRMDENLRLGTRWRPPHLRTHFQFPQDGGDFARAALRCVGVGKCRRTEGGTMCPSFMVTREEKHTTRGRAHMLFEMLTGDPIRGGWRDDHVKEALDLCLACKGCKGDCPVKVDMATYKAEFLSHYYSRRLRPSNAYALGLIYWTARAASRFPRMANLLTHAPGFSWLIKGVARVAPQRDLPRFAERTLTELLRDRSRPHSTGPPVLLWPDTFTNHFHPQIGAAAADVLEAAGFHVLLPTRPLCCGRPLYDYGMLRLAKRQLRQILSELQPFLEEGVPVVGLEPSCVAVFRDELPNLFPHDPDAQRLSSQTFTLAEFLARKAPGFLPPQLPGHALVQVHCHHRAVMGFTEEEKLLRRLGLEVEVLDSGCCGMAGSFGFEAGEHYEVSMRCAERVLFPSIRGATDETIVVADGFSCREQIRQGVGRTAYHLAEVIGRAVELERSGSRAPTP